MSPRTRFVLEGLCHHTISTTLNREPIFADSEDAQVLVDAIQFIRTDKAFVIAYAVMPDHLHLLLVPKDSQTISGVMNGLKGYAARSVNKRLGRSGPIWQRSFFDRVIREEAQLNQTIAYIEANPVKEGLLAQAAAYRFSSAYEGVETDFAAWS